MFVLIFIDRVRIAEWIRRLSGSPDSSCNSDNWSKIKNEYAQFLRIQMKGSPLRLVSPFTRPVPQHDLPPLAEMLGYITQESVRKFPKTGDGYCEKEQLNIQFVFYV